MNLDTTPDDHPLAEAFDDEARAAAWRLFRAGAASIKQDGTEQIVAWVRDGASYEVRVLGKLPDIRARCDCWLSRNGRRCAHMFAALLCAESEGLLDLSELRDPSQTWRTRLRRARRSFGAAPRRVRKPPAANYEIAYLIQPGAVHGTATLALYYRKVLRSGDLGQPHRFRADEHLPPTPADEALCAMLLGATVPTDTTAPATAGEANAFPLEGPLVAMLIPRMCETGRLFVLHANQWIGPCRLDAETWSFRLAIRDTAEPGTVQLEAECLRGDRAVPLGEVAAVLREGFAFLHDGTAVRLDTHGMSTWLSVLGKGPLTAPQQDRLDLLRELLGFDELPDLDVEGARIETADPPLARLVIHRRESRTVTLDAQVFFRYRDFEVDGIEGVAGHEVKTGVFRMRNRDAEHAAFDVLERSGATVSRAESGRPIDVVVEASRMADCVTTLLGAGWIVEAEGHRQRMFRDMRMSVKSGIDWFDLEGTVQFDEISVPLGQVLAALKKGQGLVQLGDGSVGMLPEDWLQQFGLITSIGVTQKKRIRLSRSQGWVLDALLASRSELQVDADFERYRERLHGFNGLTEQAEEGTFNGTLRDYQRVGLGWLGFLGEFGLGGCLADDMGLGKTVQVLALLEMRRHRGTLKAPALVVAPRSVVSNWVSEARRFTPELKVLEHIGPARHRNIDRLGDYHLVVTTYGALRSDAVLLKDTRFSYAVLDEAQAIKNPRSLTAKAARLVQAEHRLALSGTPIENHLGELWSLFDFLNPGMLGRSATFQRITQARGLLTDEGVRAMMRRAMRPFILRRTKEQVERSLPPRVEQSIHCEMDPPQRELYESFRAHYRQSLAADDMTTGAFRMHVLEALLRLRQVACHPGLIDPARAGESSAKLDALLPMVREVVEEGHKALLFSQFTSFLDILQTHLANEPCGMARLDGSTRDRPEQVERFQTDPDCRLFLISLKAGGVGLNLTAADYVFLLDPWWNPAAEAQAIDRAHRIGRTRPVLAYRLICRDTVEEKILELQAQKRKLFEAVLTEDTSLLKSLTAEDLEFLLS